MLWVYFVGHAWVLWDAGLGHADIFFKINSFQQFSLEHSSMPDARYITLSPAMTALLRGEGWVWHDGKCLYSKHSGGRVR